MDMKIELIAPCGINCRLCYAYIRKKDACPGCNAPEMDKPKSCRNCKIIHCDTRIRNGWVTCAPCTSRCRRIKDLDKRYRTKYHMSVIEHIDFIQLHGMDAFLIQQDRKFRCAACGGILCVHSETCPNCHAPAWE